VRQYNRESPYQQQNDRSKRVKMQPPRDLLGWFMDWYYAETTGTPHRRGLWVDAKHRSDPAEYQPVGGSVLGSPATTDAFRVVTDGEAFETVTPEYEGHRELTNVYKTPLRAALARVAGRGKADDPGPFMSIVLHRTFLRDGDWDGACASMGIVEPVRRVYIESALRRLYDRFHEEPPNRTLRSEDKAA
jgi:hypothetical protein